MALPSGLDAFAVRVARLLPDGALVRVLPRRLAFAPAVQFGLPPVADEPVRLFIGPVNFAGQGWQWARTVRRFLPGATAMSMAYSAGSVYDFPVDQPVPASVYLMSRAWQRQQRNAVLAGFTHVIVEAGRSLFGDVYRQSVVDQVRELQRAGISVALLTHGSDMRVPERHLAAHEYSPFGPGDWDLTPTLTVETARNHALRREVDVPVYVSTPGMLADVPDGVWLPVVVDPASWATGAEPLADERPPLIVHAPSSTAVKGTQLIEPVIARLVDEGLVRYDRVQGVPAEAMPDRIRAADIVLDQFRIGDYGVAACEAMAAGRLVIGNVDESVRAHVLTTTGRDLPVLQADPGTLESVLRSVVADRVAARARAAEGPVFVDEVHDGRWSASVLGGFLGVAPTIGGGEEDV